MSETTVTSKDLANIALDLVKFWEPYFDSKNIIDHVFIAKLCYLAKEFSPEKVDCIRLFPWEIKSGNDIYIELTNWENELFHTGMRRLYKYTYDPAWESSGKALKVQSPKGPSYIIKVSDLEIVNTSSIVAVRPEMEFENSEKLFKNTLFDEITEEQDDEHFNKMTIRDLYCMLKNVPLSNKKWLNNLIKETCQKT